MALPISQEKHAPVKGNLWKIWLPFDSVAQVARTPHFLLSLFFNSSVFWSELSRSSSLILSPKAAQSEHSIHNIEAFSLLFSICIADEATEQILKLRSGHWPLRRLNAVTSKWRGQRSLHRATDWMFCPLQWFSESKESYVSKQPKCTRSVTPRASAWTEGELV